ncbi:hypothetical protein ACTXT7_012469 [Hymenolepis weldensis]
MCQIVGEPIRLQQGQALQAPLRGRDNLVPEIGYDIEASSESTEQAAIYSTSGCHVKSEPNCSSK